jgi:hypothetical protein
MVFIISDWFLGHWILHVHLAFWILDGFSAYGSLFGQIAFFNLDTGFSIGVPYLTGFQWGFSYILKKSGFS